LCDSCRRKQRPVLLSDLRWRRRSRQVTRRSRRRRGQLLPELPPVSRGCVGRLGAASGIGGERQPDQECRCGDFAEARRCRPGRCWRSDSRDRDSRGDRVDCLHRVGSQSRQLALNHHTITEVRLLGSWEWQASTPWLVWQTATSVVSRQSRDSARFGSPERSGPGPAAGQKRVHPAGVTGVGLGLSLGTARGGGRPAGHLEVALGRPAGNSRPPLSDLILQPPDVSLEARAEFSGEGPGPG
jgi:hypothetical protein